MGKERAEKKYPTRWERIPSLLGKSSHYDGEKSPTIVGTGGTPYTLSIRLLRIGLLFPMKTEPIEVGKSSLALGTCGEVEQCKAICRPVQAQIHLQHIADGTESDTVQAIIEAGGEILVGDTCLYPHFVLLEVLNGSFYNLTVVAHHQFAIAAFLLHGYVGVWELKYTEARHVSVFQSGKFHLYHSFGAGALDALCQCVARTLEVGCQRSFRRM